MGRIIDTQNARVVSVRAPSSSPSRIKYACLPIKRCSGLHVRRHPRQTCDYERSGGLNGQANNETFDPCTVQIIAGRARFRKYCDSRPGRPAGRLNRAMFASAEHRVSSSGGCRINYRVNYATRPFY